MAYGRRSIQGTRTEWWSMNVKVQDGDVSMRGETHTVKSARMAVETLGAVVGEDGALHMDY